MVLAGQLVSKVGLAMSPADVADLARLSYADHPGAAPLLAAVADETLPIEMRWRALAALDVLDPKRPAPALDVEAPLAPVARAIAAIVLAAVYSTDRDERKRASKLFSELCAEAARIEERRQACVA
jgi:hypothetical protein